jgi:hypothetical protein
MPSGGLRSVSIGPAIASPSFRLDGSRPRAMFCAGRGRVFALTMLIDLVIAVIIVAIAAVLGLVVHPILWVIVIFAVLWLFTRRGRWA